VMHLVLAALDRKLSLREFCPITCSLHSSAAQQNLSKTKHNKDQCQYQK
jgi:hypothetical protein